MSCTYTVYPLDAGMYEISIALPYYATEERMAVLHDNARYLALAHGLLTRREQQGATT